MFNHAAGVIREDLGRMFIETYPGFMGHAVFGPYVALEPDDYIVQFFIKPVEPNGVGQNEVCCVVDIVTNSGRDCLVSRELTLEDVSGQEMIFLCFRLTERTEVEFRVGVCGNVVLEIDRCRRLQRVPEQGDVREMLTADQLPDLVGAPAFYRDNISIFHQLYERGLGISVQDSGIILSMDGVKFHANSHDDMIFINEIFFERVYNLEFGREVCVIDIGLNVGLASLQFATKSFVRRIHAFEPFESTYRRALANFALNPDLSSKIFSVNAGLGAADAHEIFYVPEASDSGARSVRNVEGGTPIQIEMRVAASALRPIIEQARAEGLAVVAKIDCEGSEYEIFNSLEVSGVLKEISTFIVEWHGGFSGKSQATLVAPLIDNGFVVVDRSPRIGQGVFYAIQLRDLQ